MAPTDPAAPWGRQRVVRAGVWSRAPASFREGGSDTVPTAASRPVSFQAAGNAAICIVPAPIAVRQGSTGTRCPFAAGRAAVLPGSCSGSAARSPATSPCAERRACPIRARAGRGTAFRRAGGCPRRASEYRSAAPRRYRRPKPQTQGQMRERTLFVVACALQPILESPVQVCIDRQLRGQDRGVRFLDLVQLLIGLPLLKAETGGHDQ